MRQLDSTNITDTVLETFAAGQPLAQSHRLRPLTISRDLEHLGRTGPRSRLKAFLTLRWL
jgi:hypothetical protein